MSEPNGDPFQWADELGPAKIVYLHDAGAGLRAVVAIEPVTQESVVA